MLQFYKHYKTKTYLHTKDVHFYMYGMSTLKLTTTRLGARQFKLKTKLKATT